MCGRCRRGLVARLAVLARVVAGAVAGIIFREMERPRGFARNEWEGALDLTLHQPDRDQVSIGPWSQGKHAPADRLPDRGDRRSWHRDPLAWRWLAGCLPGPCLPKPVSRPAPVGAAACRGRKFTCRGGPPGGHGKGPDERSKGPLGAWPEACHRFGGRRPLAGSSRGCRSRAATIIM